MPLGGGRRRMCQIIFKVYVYSCTFYLLILLSPAFYSQLIQIQPAVKFWTSFWPASQTFDAVFDVLTRHSFLGCLQTKQWNLKLCGLYSFLLHVQTSYAVYLRKWNVLKADFAPISVVYFVSVCYYLWTVFLLAVIRCCCWSCGKKRHLRKENILMLMSQIDANYELQYA